MATASLPTAGTYPVTLSSALFASTAKKRKREEGEILALRYAFKPASMTAVTEAAVGPTDNGAMVLRAETSSHGPQGFDVREEQSKSRECVLVYDQATHTFTLHPLTSTAHLTLNRSAPSIKSTTSQSTSASSTSSSQRGAESHVVIEGSRTKRSRPSDIVLERPRVGGKGIPRKGVPAPSTAAPTFNQATKAIGRGKANPKKAAPTKKAVKKAPPTPQGKFKSAETIEDSDEEYDLTTRAAEPEGQAVDVEDEEDDFAKMLGESLAGGTQEAGEEEEDDDDDEDEEDEDDDELGGARLVVRQDASSMANGESEWL